MAIIVLLLFFGLPILLTILNLVNFFRKNDIYKTVASVFTLIIGLGFSVLWFWFFEHRGWYAMGRYLRQDEHIILILLRNDDVIMILLLFFCSSIIGFLVLRFCKKPSPTLSTLCTASLLLGCLITILYMIQRGFRISLIHFYIANVWLIYLQALRQSSINHASSTAEKAFYKENNMELQKEVKLKLLGYLLISMVGFSYLVFIAQAGISVPIFILIQFGCLYFLLPRKKPLLLFIPIFILSLNWFISGSSIWRVSNFFVMVGLFSLMSLWSVGTFSTKNRLAGFIYQVVGNVFRPFRHFQVPFKWVGELTQEQPRIDRSHGRTAKRILAGIGLSLPLLLIILVMLSSADAIFARSVMRFFEQLADVFSIGNVNVDGEAIFRMVVGGLAGFYLFGLIYFIYTYKPNYGVALYQYKKPASGDAIMINIILGSILVVYTLFVGIQFRYLFASAGQLPYGLNYVDYARRGFFELLFLSFVNVTIILIATWLMKNQNHIGAKISQWLCGYLCVVTIILLISSFYRMSLYSGAYGLTRLRFLVFGFLVFEAIGLIFTLFYIAKPKFNILAVYAVIGLSYYILLNVMPMDAIVARNQVDRYFENGGDGITYVLNLSADAARQVSRLQNSYDEQTLRRVQDYYIRIKLDDGDWRHWNLATARAMGYDGSR